MTMKSRHCRRTLVISLARVALLIVWGWGYLVTPYCWVERVPRPQVFHPGSSAHPFHVGGRYGQRLFADGSAHETNEGSFEDSKISQPAAGVDDASLSAPICRLVTRADAKLPDKPPMLPSPLFNHQNQHLLDSYYHGQAHKTTRQLQYFEQFGTDENANDEPVAEDRNEEEEKLVSSVRSSLEDAGFQLLSRRDLDLCESLNAGYLLRLSILPDVKELDPNIALEFYPEMFHSTNGTAINPEEILFDGRVLVYWRGYSEEVTTGRLLLPKIDYLQASLVQRSAAWLKARLDAIESKLARRIFLLVTSTRRRLRLSLLYMIKKLPLKTVANSMRSLILGLDKSSFTEEPANNNGRFRLARYGGSKTKFVGSPNPNDALDPFTICEIDYSEPALRPNMNSKFERRRTENSNAERCLYKEINQQTLTCEYDETMFQKETMPTMELLDRVSISNLVDLFSRSGRRKLLSTIFARSELVEPTYEEVVVIWRPLNKIKPPKFVPPDFVVEFADMFDIEGFERPSKEDTEPLLGRLEMRNYQGVQMANLPAVLPKTKLIFRPADAFLFDAISFVTFLLVASSIKLDNPRLDLLALVSVSLWLIRTVIRYSNKLARYDLLVKTFLTSKISHRNSGAMKYLASEAGSQRAIRAALVHSWLLDVCNVSCSGGNAAPAKRSDLVGTCGKGVNNMLRLDRLVDVDADMALLDLEDLGIVSFDDDGEQLTKVLTREEAVTAIKDAWMGLLDSPYEIDKRTLLRSPDVSRDLVIGSGAQKDWRVNLDDRGLASTSFELSDVIGAQGFAVERNKTSGFSSNSPKAINRSSLAGGRTSVGSLGATLGNSASNSASDGDDIVENKKGYS